MNVFFSTFSLPTPMNAFPILLICSLFSLVLVPSMADNARSPGFYRGCCKEEEASVTVKLIVHVDK